MCERGRGIAKPYVNTAALATSRNPNEPFSPQQALLEGHAGKNCALLSAAGAVNLILGQSHWTSGLVAQRLSVNDFKLAMGTSHWMQARNIIKFVNQLTSRFGAVIGPVDNNLHFGNGPRVKELIQKMGRYPNGTGVRRFRQRTRPEAGDERTSARYFAHWLNARVAGGVVRFFDFQSNANSTFPGTRNPATSPVPFLAVITQTQSGATSKNLHGANQAGEDTTRITRTVSP